MEVIGSHRTVEEWETVLGEQVRAARIASELDQEHLAALADISVGALSNLERGKGSSLKTLVAVVRALGRTEWLEALAPPVTVSPMQMLRAKRRSPRARVRVRTRNPQVGGHR
jgi:transcriptional regulator with XRE-family HTH domain